SGGGGKGAGDGGGGGDGQQLREPRRASTRSDQATHRDRTSAAPTRGACSPPSARQQRGGVLGLVHSREPRMQPHFAAFARTTCHGQAGSRQSVRSSCSTRPDASPAQLEHTPASGDRPLPPFA